ncbi:hypothetical protein P4O66_003230 [Electrophorus voltai]|uniref:Uncharacterized protein n=1 Tax=Electrophorus voltai TaxID=2609070 RepID=A0AAD8YTT0_9TELE|nr:hypothetical protein P4O66_003230 [Electrophorus voltai]
MYQSGSSACDRVALLPVPERLFHLYQSGSSTCARAALQHVPERLYSICLIGHSPVVARLPPPAPAADKWQWITDEDRMTRLTFPQQGVGGRGEEPGGGPVLCLGSLEDEVVRRRRICQVASDRVSHDSSLILHSPGLATDCTIAATNRTGEPATHSKHRRTLKRTEAQGHLHLCLCSGNQAIEGTIILNMTHGEESGPETHQDSAVLTYLEGLLMHRVAGAQGAKATQQGEAGGGNEDQRNKEQTGLTLPSHSDQQDKTAAHGGTTQHLKKARLLRSEAWTECESQKRSTASTELNGQKEELHGGMNGSSQCKGESTLLASLLQSFSTRLQNVALSQHIVQNLMQQNASSPVREPDQIDKASEHSLGSAPSHFKGVTGNASVQNHSINESYDHRRTSQKRLSESPMTPQHSSRSPSSESLPCTERLKAVASLVNIRSSPAPSPKPSVACSQLALLLSSEAHLQQYSREQALKAQLAGRSASERLAAMATQQTHEKKQPMTSGQSQSNQDTLSSLHTKNGIPSQMSTNSSRQSPGLSTGQSRSEGSVTRAHPFRERRPFERHGRPSQNCSSLLLQLLNSHNTPQRLTCQGHMKEDVSIFSSRDSPLFSDSEHSNPASSLPKDSSDAESTHSSCSPIDLSLKGKINIPATLSSSSSPARDKVTESPKNKWMLNNSPPKVPVGHQERNPFSLCCLTLMTKADHRGFMMELGHSYFVFLQNYYDSLETSDDLQTSAACSASSRLLSQSAREAFSQVHPEVCKRFLSEPQNLKGSRVLDLGSGSGRGCYVLVYLVSTQKSPQCIRSLCFSFSRVEGMGSILYWQYLISVMKELGFSTPHLVDASHIHIHNPELQVKAGDIKFASGTYRVFKFPQHFIQTKALVTYKGTVPDCPECFEFDASYTFKYRHLNPFTVADRLGSSVKQRTKLGSVDSRANETASAICGRTAAVELHAVMAQAGSAKPSTVDFHAVKARAGSPPQSCRGGSSVVPVSCQCLAGIEAPVRPGNGRSGKEKESEAHPPFRPGATRYRPEVKVKVDRCKLGHLAM